MFDIQIYFLLCVKLQNKYDYSRFYILRQFLNKKALFSLNICLMCLHLLSEFRRSVKI